MVGFKTWLISEAKHAKKKLGLYPPLYTQYYNYPPSDIVTWTADAITYMDDEDLVQKIVDGFYAKIVRKTIDQPGKTAAGGH